MNSIINGIVKGLSLYIGWQIGKKVYPRLFDWSKRPLNETKLEIEKKIT